jgi:hypothetical protein
MHVIRQDIQPVTWAVTATLAMTVLKQLRSIGDAETTRPARHAIMH